jgi:hypothetical protein
MDAQGGKTLLLLLHKDRHSTPDAELVVAKTRGKMGKQFDGRKINIRDI